MRARRNGLTLPVVERESAQAVGALEAELRDRIVGEVRFTDGDRALYATDASNYRQVPIGVVVPRTVQDIVDTVAVARRHEAPVLLRGGGTSLAGQCCNVAIVLDTSKFVNQVIEVDGEHRRARVEPGVTLDVVRQATEPFELTFGPDPATHTHCTIGGMIGNDSCGPHSVLSEFYGPGPRTADNIEALDILTYDGLRLEVARTSDAELDGIIAGGGRRGAIYGGLRDLRDRYADRIRERFPKILRRVSGYNLDALLPENGFNVAQALVGTEGTCVAVLGATLSLVPRFRARALVALGYESVYEAAGDVMRVREFRPIALEGMDDRLVADMKDKGLHPRDVALLPDGRGWLLVEFGGDTRAEAEEYARNLMDAVRRGNTQPTAKLFVDRAEEQKIWTVRQSGLGATAFIPNKRDTWEGWEDSAVPVQHLADYLRDLRALYDRYGYTGDLYGHFGQGCVHTRIDFDLYTAAGIAHYRDFTRDAAELVVHKYGGSLSGEHGDGQSRGDLLPIMFGDDLVRAFREFKAIWDPDGRMNPGKVVDPAPRTAHLRLGTEYEPAQPATHFQFPDDRRSFARATLRCVGVGDCRRHEGGTMCPSYMVLREEKHATRGRAHLLFEMLRGETITDGWRSEAVKESLDLCLACKGCKGDCPVNVDVATYKAEFLSHYYDGRLRPRHAYAFGLIRTWAELASHVPGLVNFVTHAPGLSRVAKWMAGVAREREIPRFAPHPFTRSFRKLGSDSNFIDRTHRKPATASRQRVILWPDTFNNFFFPGTLSAAAEVLEDAGVRVTIPRQSLCCGRPLYDYGMLDRAKERLRAIVAALRDDIEAGVPIIGLEPSCVAVFRDELHGLFPNDVDAQRLREQVFTLGEFLADHVDDYAPPPLQRKAIVHGHCHHKSIMTLRGEERILDAIGLDYRLLASGCCGMAGSFGFERDKYDLSVAVGERVLLPAVREAEPATIVVADGFSCREQIAQTTGRRALHLAEVLQLALHENATASRGAPERLAAREEIADDRVGHTSIEFRNSPD